jgi:hypothetical protein
VQNVHTIFANFTAARFYAHRVTNRDRLASWLSGFWACLTGGVGIAVLLVVLDPAMRTESCSNYGGNGNASAFGDTDWDLWFPLVLLGWWALIVMEQVLPVTRRQRGGVEVAARGVWALALAVVGSCCLMLKLVTMCH